MTTPLRQTLRAIHGRSTLTRHAHSIAVCDVDHFDAYERTFGRDASHAVLERAAAVARAELPASAEVHVAEGGLVLVLPDHALPDACRVTDRVLDAVERLGVARGDGGVVTMSAGVAEVDPTRDRTPSDWLARADAACCGAKADGRNHVECMS